MKKKFDDLWDDKDSTVKVIELPKIAHELIDGYKSSKTMLDLDKKLLKKYGEEEPESVYFKTPEWLKNNKRPYQENAIEKWVAAG